MLRATGLLDRKERCGGVGLPGLGLVRHGLQGASLARTTESPRVGRGLSVPQARLAVWLCRKGASEFIASPKVFVGFFSLLFDSCGVFLIVSCFKLP